MLSYSPESRQKREFLISRQKDYMQLNRQKSMSVFIQSYLEISAHDQFRSTTLKCVDSMVVGNSMAVGSRGLGGLVPLFFRIRGLSPPKNSLSKHASKVVCRLLVSIDLSILVKIVINVSYTSSVC